MKLNKKALAFIIVIIVITSIIVPITIILQTNPESQIETPSPLDVNRGFQVTYNEVPSSDPIVILNPKECNIFYYNPYWSNREYILLNYRTAPGVNASEYILDGEAPQLIPLDNKIQTPDLGNHTLMLTGTNSTGNPCSSKTVNFYIGNTIRGICGAPPECYDLTYSSTAHFAVSNYGFGLITDTEFEQELFLEGPEKPITETAYTKTVDLKYEAITTFVPFIILRSEPWYDHSVEVINSHWVNLVSGGVIVNRIWVTTGSLFIANDGETLIIYFLVNILHVFGTVTYWNEESRYYDVFSIEVINYFNKYVVSYNAGEPIKEYPILNPTDFSQFSGVYYDKNMTENEFWGWKKYEDWIQSYGLEASIFLGNYAGANSCPVPVLFSLPQLNIMNNELIPDEINHIFTRTDSEPETFEANYRGLENTFSMNIISI